MLLADVGNVSFDYRVKVLGAAVVLELLATVIGQGRPAEERDGIGARHHGDGVEEHRRAGRLLRRVVRLELDADLVLFARFQAARRIDDDVTGPGRQGHPRHLRL